MPAISQSQGLVQAQRQTMALSQQMRKSLELLAMGVPELRGELARELAANPAIEDIRFGDGDIPLSAAAPEEHTADSPADRELDFRDDPKRMEAVLSADDGYRDAFLKGLESSTGDDEEDSRRSRFLDSRLRKPRSLQEYILAQIPVSGIPAAFQPLARMLAGNIDERGFFTGSIPDIRMISGASEDEVEETLGAIKRLDPPGCGSRGVAEYLLSRLAEIPAHLRDDAKAILSGPLFKESGPAAPARRIEEARKASGLDSGRFSAALSAIGRLDPYPASGFDRGEETLPTVSPDVFLTSGPDGEPDVFANPRETPVIRFSERFKELASRKDLSPEEAQYVRARIKSAMELAEALEKRTDSILAVSREIVAAQPAFFKTGDWAALKPLTMLKVAAKTGLHEATVSRTVNGKYIQTPWGLFELRRFFASGVETARGGVASGAAAEMIKRLVDAEDKSNPLSDEAIARRLAAEGVKIARRTVAKYRNSLQIPGAAERKILMHRD